MAIILVIDDDPDMRDLLEEALVAAGHKPFFAADGKQGLQLLRHTAPDLIVLDMLMPELDGIEFLKKLPPHGGPKIIAISGAPGDWNLLEFALALGARKTLAKPFTRGDLIAAINAVLTAG